VKEKKEEEGGGGGEITYPGLNLMKLNLKSAENGTLVAVFLCC